MGRGQRPRPTRLASKLLRIRVGLGLSQSEMLGRLRYDGSKLAVGHISDFERDKREPPLPALLRYAEAAGVPLETLVDDRLELPEMPTPTRETSGLVSTARGMITGSSPFYPDSPSGARLRFLFLSANNSVIARLLRVNSSTVHTFMKSDARVADYVLDRIFGLTGVDEAWIRNASGPIFSQLSCNESIVRLRVNALVTHQLQLPAGRNYSEDYSAAELILRYFDERPTTIVTQFQRALARHLKPRDTGTAHAPGTPESAMAICLAALDLCSQYLHARIRRHPCFGEGDAFNINREAGRRYAERNYVGAWMLWLTLYPDLHRPSVPGPWSIIYAPTEPPPLVLPFEEHAYDHLREPKEVRPREPKGLRNQAGSRKTSAARARSARTAKPTPPDTPAGARIRSLFEGADDTAIATALDVRPSAVNRALTGERIPHGFLVRLVAHTNCNISWVRTGVGQPIIEKR